MQPKHGRIACRKCFSGDVAVGMHLGPWKILNDPCYWGSSNPTCLVLGFSKGFTQADELQTGAFENVPFKSMRSRLGRVLKEFNLLIDEALIDAQFSNPENSTAFASLIRCSVSRVDEKPGAGQTSGVYSCTGALIPKSFKEIPQIVQNCAEQFLLDLPSSIRMVLLLGNGDAYIKNTKKLLNQLFRNNYREINKCAAEASGKIWIWAAHPSGLNGHFDSWISGVGKQGQKRQAAIEASGCLGIERQ